MTVTIMISASDRHEPESLAPAGPCSVTVARDSVTIMSVLSSSSLRDSLA